MDVTEGINIVMGKASRWAYNNISSGHVWPKLVGQNNSPSIHQERPMQITRNLCNASSFAPGSFRCRASHIICMMQDLNSIPTVTTKEHANPPTQMTKRRSVHIPSLLSWYCHQRLWCKRKCSWSSSPSPCDSQYSDWNSNSYSMHGNGILLRYMTLDSRTWSETKPNVGLFHLQIITSELSPILLRPIKTGNLTEYRSLWTEIAHPHSRGKDSQVDPCPYIPVCNLKLQLFNRGITMSL